MPGFKKSAVIRYAPACAVAGCALILFAHLQDEPPASLRKADSSKPIAAPDTVFKSPHRAARERQAAAKASTIRKPILNGDLLEPISVEEATREIAGTKDLSRPTARGRIAREIIRRLCASGQPETAFALIEGETSEAREAGLRAFFETSPENEESLLKRIIDLDAPEDAATALTAYLPRIPFAELERFIAQNESIRPYLNKGLSDYLREKLISTTHKDELLALVDRLHPQGLVDDRLAIQVLTYDKKTDPFEQWERLNQRGFPRDNALYRSSSLLLVDRMAEADPSRTAEWMLASVKAGKLEDQEYIAGRAFGNWAWKDRPAAVAWYHSHSAEIPRELHDAVSWAFSMAAMNAGGEAEAHEWLAAMNDPVKKQRLSEILLKPKRPSRR